MPSNREVRTTFVAEVEGQKAVEQYADTIEQVEKQGDVETKIKVDTRQAARDVGKLDQLLDGLTDDEQAVVIKAVTDQARTEVRILERELKKIDEPHELQMKAGDIVQARAAVEQLEGRLDALGDAGDRARAKVDDIGKSASSSKSVLANMVGNATQDLGALTGVAGSAGVAIGQMGEYMADAAAEGEGLGSVFRNFGKVLGPVVGLSVGVGVVSALVKSFQAGAKAIAAAADDLSKRIKQANGDVNEALETRALDEWSDSTVNRLAAVGLTFTDVSKGIKGDFTPAMQAVVDVLQSVDDQMGSSAGEIDVTTEAFTRWRESLGLSEADALKLFTSLQKVGDFLETEGVALDRSSEAWANREKFFGPAIKNEEELGEATESEGEARKRANEEWEAFQKAASEAKQQRLIDLIDESAEALAGWDTAAEKAALAGEAWLDAMSPAEKVLDNLSRISDVEAGYDDLTQALKDNGHSWDVTTEEGRKNLAVTRQLFAAQEELIAAQIAQGASTDEVRAQMVRMREAIVLAMEAAGAGKDEIAAVLQQMGLLDTDIETRISVAVDADAAAKLAALSGAIQLMSKPVQLQIAALMASGSNEQALALFNAALKAEQAGTPFDVNAWLKLNAPTPEQVQQIANETQAQADALDLTVGLTPKLVSANGTSFNASTAGFLAMAGISEDAVLGTVNVKLGLDTKEADADEAAFTKRTQKETKKPLALDKAAAERSLSAYENEADDPVSKPLTLQTAAAYGALRAFEGDANDPITKTVQVRFVDAATGQTMTRQQANASTAQATGNTIINMPRGANGRDVLAAQRRHAKRNGGLR